MPGAATVTFVTPRLENGAKLSKLSEEATEMRLGRAEGIKSCDLSGKLSNKLWRVETDGGIYFYIGRDGTEYYEPEAPAKELSWVAPFRFGFEDVVPRAPLTAPRA